MAYLQEYDYLRTLGSGSYATVFKGRHIKLDYVRAIRELHGGIDSEDSKLYRDFLDECKLLLRLGNGGHPNIVHIYQPRLLENKALVEMDYIEGCDLESYLKEQHGFITIDEVMRFVKEISSALAYCHEDIYKFCIDKGKKYTYELDNHLKGGTFSVEDDPDDAKKNMLTDSQRKELIHKYKVIHNDLHSKNIMRKKYDGSYILLDFGLSIQNGTVVKSSKRKGGAPEYKAPEKWDDEGIVSEQSDIYSFGVLLYEMLAGREPFPYDKSLPQQPAEYKLREQHLTDTPPDIEPLRNAAFEATHPGETYEKDYPDWLEKVIRKCLEKKPENRYANGKELFLEVKKNIEQTNNDELKKLKEQNERLDLLENEKTELDSQINSLAKQLARATFDTEKSIKENSNLKEEIQNLKKERDEFIEMNEKLSKQIKDEPKKSSSGLWKVITGIAVMLAIAAVLFAYLYKPSNNIETNSYETTISQQKTEIENLQNQNGQLQNNLDNANTKYKQLEDQVNSAGNSNTAALVEKQKEIDRLKNQLANAGNGNAAVVAAKQQEIDRLTRDNIALKSSVSEKDRTISSQKDQLQTAQKTIDRLLGNK